MESLAPLESNRIPLYRTFTSRMLGAFLAVDVLFMPVMAVAFLVLVGDHSPEGYRKGAIEYAGTAAFAEIVWAVFLTRVTLPVTRWLAGDSIVRTGELEKMAHVSHRLPTWAAHLWSIKWSVHSAYLVSDRDLLDNWAARFFLVALVFGPWPLAHSLATWISTPVTRELWRLARVHGLRFSEQRSSLARELVAYTTCLTFAPATYLASLVISAADQGMTSSSMIGGLATYLGSVAVYALLCSILLAVTVHRPLSHVIESMKKIAREGRVVEIERIPMERHGEIGELTSTANWMLDRLESTENERAGYQSSLEELNRSLERRVEARTAEVQDKMLQLKETQATLVSTARRAGMADVAIGVLHNVGNVLNSVNVSLGCLKELTVSKTATATDRGVRLLLDQPEPDRFLSEDPRGKRALEYLRAAVAASDAHRAEVYSELARLERHVDHVKAIVVRQQSLARSGSMSEVCSLERLTEEAIEMISSTCANHQIELRRDYDDELLARTDGHKLIQIVLNLLTNAVDAVKQQDHQRRISVYIRSLGDDQAAIEVRDNGVGIEAQHLDALFRHQFTTKSDGHGFGLHASACAAEELGGRLAAHSAGPGTGAAFTLAIPAFRRPAESVRSADGIARGATPSA
ncbi:MAG: ATP-binding protein [Myxococcales bacterium]|nr:ATP-binding protein [Myxococcales bacterium]